ncbi:MAG: histone deacetylase family protein [Methylococcaceae bacterium]|nr:histone deacetylase family protein [Methylococcaceae bacterium]
MTTFFYSHPAFFEHQTGSAHPESPYRLTAIATALLRPEFVKLIHQEAPRAEPETLRLVHTEQHIRNIFDLVPDENIIYLDPDTVLSRGSGQAALRAVGAVCAAIDAVFNGEAHNAFCGVRPPGHHAMPEAAMGFCLFNNIAVGAEYARRHHRIKRVAIVDFDVHHGNGTQACFEDNPNVLYASTHQHPWYPGTGNPRETGVGNIFNVGLPSGSGSKAFRDAMTHTILPAVDRFKPELVLVSAGFDAHRDDPLASLELDEEDFGWITTELLTLADRHAGGRLVSALEGGYNLEALRASVAAHVRALMGAC